MSQLILTEKSFMGLDKSRIRYISSDYVDRIQDGHIDPVEALILSKKIQELGKELENGVRPIAESDHAIGSRESLVKYSAEVRQKETGVKYDFTACGDEEWDKLNAQMLSIKEQMAEREKFLKNLTKPMADTDTGLVINPPIRTGKIGLAVTLK